MSIPFGRIHAPSWRSARRQAAGDGASRLRGGLRDRLYSLAPGDRGLEARAWSRMRRARLPQDSVTVEAWHGTLTVRGGVPPASLPQYGYELAQIRGVGELLNFLRAA